MSKITLVPKTRFENKKLKGTVSEMASTLLRHKGAFCILIV
jgi:hypothetical protein